MTMENVDGRWLAARSSCRETGGGMAAVVITPPSPLSPPRRLRRPRPHSFAMSWRGCGTDQLRDERGVESQCADDDFAGPARRAAGQSDGGAGAREYYGSSSVRGVAPAPPWCATARGRRMSSRTPVPDLCSPLSCTILWLPDGVQANNAYRSFVFDMAQGRRLALADIFKSGVDPLQVISLAARPLLPAALDAAPPPHEPGTYPFTVQEWSPDPAVPAFPATTGDGPCRPTS